MKLWQQRVTELERPFQFNITSGNKKKWYQTNHPIMLHSEKDNSTFKECPNFSEKKQLSRNSLTQNPLQRNLVV